jgi:selenophosphate synthetase-related protein
MVAEATDWQQKILGNSEKEIQQRIDMTANDNDGLVRAAKDITAGSVGGIAQVLTGQPFDIVKVNSPPSIF